MDLTRYLSSSTSLSIVDRIVFRIFASVLYLECFTWFLGSLNHYTLRYTLLHISLCALPFVKINIFWFSVSYWAAGGLGTCQDCDQVCIDKENAKDNGGCIENGGCEVTNGTLCYNYIYPITDWGNHPGLATITVFVGVIILPICHLFWLGMFKLRMHIYHKTHGEGRPAFQHETNF